MPGGHADAEHIAPTLGEIEQMGVEQRADDVLRHDDEPGPGGKPLAAEQQKMREPHREQHRGADQAELDRHGKGLIVRV